MSEKTTPRQCTVTLLTDTPVGRDDFHRNGELGPHERLANSIADVIRSKESGGTMVGLAGDWGSGKSNIVKMVNSRLANQGEHRNDFTVAEFDAWAHEGDPLRRTFLESLIDTLLDEKKNWVDRSKWKGEKEKLAKRLQVTDQESTTLPTKLGLFLSLAVSLIPFGAVLINRSMENGATYLINRSYDVALMLIIGTFLATTPLTIAIFNGLRLLIWERKSLDWNVDNTVWEIENWSFINHNSKINSSTRSFQSADPTSVEFESKFAELMTEALAPENRRLLLIIDNLDRIRAEEVLKIWSALQTFLPRHGNHVPSWAKRITVLVPYAPSGLRKLLAADRDENERDADSFLDKSFQVRFHVPPPTLSSWERYLDGLLTQAVDSLEVAEKHDIYRVFDLCRAESPSSQTATSDAEITTPTPRELKLLVNQLGTLLRQWQFALPVRDMAYFCLVGRRVSDLRGALVEGRLPGERGLQICGEGLKRSLAALLFNVAPEQAMELLLGEEILATLKNGDSERLAQLERDHGDGFWLVVEGLATTRIGKSDLLTVALASKALLDSRIHSEARIESKELVGALEEATRALSSFEPTTQSVLEGLGALCELIGSSEFTSRIAEHLKEPLAKEPVVEAESMERLDALLAFIGCVTRAGHLAELKGNFQLPFSESTWSEACQRLNTLNVSDEVVLLIRPACEVSAIETILCAAATSTWTADKSCCASISARAFSSHNWSKLTNDLSTRLNANSSPSKEEGQRILTSLLELARRGNSQSKAKLKELTTQGHLLHQMDQYWGYAPFRDSCIFSYLFFGPGAAKAASEPGQATSGFSKLTQFLNTKDEAFTNALLSRALEFGEPAFLLRLRDTVESLPQLISDAVRLAVEHERYQEMFPVAELKSRWADLKAVLGQDPNSYDLLMKRSVQNGWLQDALTSKGFQSDDAAFYVEVLQQPDSSRMIEFASWCKQGLESLAEEPWRQSYENDFDEFALLFSLRTRGVNVALGPNFGDAIVAHAERVLAGEALPSPSLSQRWRECMTAIDKDGVQQDVRRRIAERASDADGSISNEWFDLYGAEVGVLSCLKDVNSVVNKLFVPLLRERHLRGIRWLISTFRNCQGAINQLGDAPALQNWTANLESWWQAETDEQVRQELHELGEMTGVNLVAPEGSTEGSNSND